MKETTIYGLKCPKEDERIVVDAVNASLKKIKRSTSKATSKSLLEARKPFVLPHYVWCLNKDCGVYFEIYRNEDLNGKLHYPNDSSIGLLVMFVIQSHGFRGGKPLKKTTEFVERVIESLGVPFELLAEGDERDEVEATLLKLKSGRTKRSTGAADMAKKKVASNDYFAEDEDPTCPPLKLAAVHAAEKSLGYRLPTAYVDLLLVHNGGYLQRSFFPTTKCPRWADDHVLFEEIMGIGKEGINGKLGSKYLISEWGYPAIGVVISCDGHTAFMLDYSKCGKDGEPRVVWVDVETEDGTPNVVVLAPSFTKFLDKLRIPPEDE